MNDLPTALHGVFYVVHCFTQTYLRFRYTSLFYVLFYKTLDASYQVLLYVYTGVSAVHVSELREQLCWLHITLNAPKALLKNSVT